MPILENYFFHNTIQLYVGAFGSIFDEISIKRGSKEIKVPIAYTNKKRYVIRDEQNPDPNKVRIKSQLPRMSYTLTGFYRDNSRVLNRMTTLIQPGNRNAIGGLNSQRNRVPYNFQFRLNIKTKNIVDLLQIVEQICVYFNPSIVINVLDNPDLDMENSLPVNLMTNDGIGDLSEGSFETEEIIETSLDFELEGYLYMPTSKAKFIKQVNVNYYDMVNNTLLDSDTFTEADLP